MKMICLTVCALLSMSCLADAAACASFAWPQGKDPAIVGRRLVKRFLSRSPDEWNRHHSKWAVGKQIAYPTACVWDGAFQFAAAVGDTNLARRVAAVYEPFYGKDAHLIPPAVHVDYTMFGGIPLGVHAVTHDRRALTTGLAMADAQWAEPKPDARVINGMADYAGQLAYWKDGYTPQTRLWIDDMFMISFVQLAAYRATGNRAYVDRVAKEMVLYLDKLQNPDGLFYHAPDAPFAWGRGNGWMAAGMTLVLKHLPKDSPYRERIVAGYCKMMATLLKFQRADGMWGQLVDDPASWPETSGSGMFAYAFIEGARNGSLDAKYGEAGRRAYLALVDYLTPEGDIREVCVGTNKRNDHGYYLARPRSVGDHHGQAPLLWCCAALCAPLNANAALQTACGLFPDGEAWKHPGMLPAAVRNPGNLTAAKWIWHQGPVQRGRDCYYRHAFNIERPVKSLVLHVAGRNGAVWYLNGRKMDGERVEVAPFLKVGRNVLAARVPHNEGAGGLLVFGRGTDAAGGRVEITSTSAFKAIGKTSGNWTTPDFDDSDWNPAREIADAASQPFSNDRDYLAEFATEEERKAVAAYAAAHPLALPAGIENEPEPDAKIVYDGYSPKISVNGRLYEPDLNATRILEDYSASFLIKSASVGFRFHQLDISPSAYEQAPGVYDFSKLGEHARRALDLYPGAYLFAVLDISIPKWCEKHPAEQIQYADGAIGTAPGDDCGGRPRRISAASQAYRAEVARLIETFGSYVRSQPWGKRVVAVRPCWGIYWEWHVYGMFHAPDVGPAMTAAFHRWKDGKYANENPPTVEERSHGDVLLDPVRDAKTIDNYHCLQSEVADCLIGAARAFKRALPGRLVGAYYGYVVDVGQPPEGANIMIDKVLAAPEIDFLSNPTMYDAWCRRAGGSHLHRSVPSTYHRYRKLEFMEDDMRFDHVQAYVKGEGDQERYCTTTPLESRMTMRRDYLNRLFDGCGIQIFDPGGLSGLGTRPSAHDNPAVLEAIHESMCVSRQVGRMADRSGNDTALVFDWRERLQRNQKASKCQAFIRTGAVGLGLAYRSGATFDVMTADDYLATPVKYGRVVFMNVFNPEASIARGLRARLAADGAKGVRLMLPEAKTGVLGPEVRETLDVPNDPGAWEALFASLGTHLYMPAGEHYIRRHGGLVMFHTAEKGPQTLKLPPEFGDREMTELFSGRKFRGPELRFETSGPDTLLFR